MITSIRDILDQCEQTASWYGIAITSLDQRNSLNDTPLHTVCSWGEVNPVKRLIAAGAKVNATGDQGCTPLFNAVIGESADVVKALLDAGCDPSIRSSDGSLPIEYAKNVRASAEVIAALGSKTGASSPLVKVLAKALDSDNGA